MKQRRVEAPAYLTQGTCPMDEEKSKEVENMLINSQTHSRANNLLPVVNLSFDPLLVTDFSSPESRKYF